MSKIRCESVFDNGRLVSRCVGEKDHTSRHYYPNMIMKKEDPELFEALQKRKTPYRFLRTELLLFDREY